MKPQKNKAYRHNIDDMQLIHRIYKNKYALSSLALNNAIIESDVGTIAQPTPYTILFENKDAEKTHKIHTSTNNEDTKDNNVCIIIINNELHSKYPNEVKSLCQHCNTKGYETTILRENSTKQQSFRDFALKEKLKVQTQSTQEIIDENNSTKTKRLIIVTAEDANKILGKFNASNHKAQIIVPLDKDTLEITKNLAEHNLRKPHMHPFVMPGWEKSNNEKKFLSYIEHGQVPLRSKNLDDRYIRNEKTHRNFVSKQPIEKQVADDEIRKYQDNLSMDTSQIAPSTNFDPISNNRLQQERFDVYRTN